MKELLQDRSTIIWVILMVATSISWYLGAEQNQAAHTLNASASVSIILITFIKVRLVMTNFMEVRTAPLLLRAACDALIAILCSSMLVLCLLALP